MKTSMKQRIILSVLCCATLQFASSHAAAGTDGIRFEIGPEFYRENYIEYVDGETFMREDSEMAGVVANLTIPFLSHHSLDLMARAAVGYSAYTGALTGDPYGSFMARWQGRRTAEARATYGYSVAAGTATVTPFASAGLRFLQDDLEELGPAGYLRRSEYTYAIAGVKGDIPFAGQWHMAPSVSYHYLLSGRQSSGGGNTDKLVHQQKTGKG